MKFTCLIQKNKLFFILRSPNTRKFAAFTRHLLCILTFQFNEGEMLHTRKHEPLQRTGPGFQSCIKIEGENPGTYVRFQPETKTLTGVGIKKEELQFCKCISIL